MPPAKETNSHAALFFGLAMAAVVAATLLLQTDLFSPGGSLAADAKPENVAETDVDTLVGGYKGEAGLNANRARESYSGRHVVVFGTIRQVGRNSLLLGGNSELSLRVYMKDDIMSVSVSDTVKVSGVTGFLFLEKWMRDAPSLKVSGGRFVR